MISSNPPPLGRTAFVDAVAPDTTGGPRPRRRLTVPRDTPLAIPPATVPAVTHVQDDDECGVPREDGAGAEPTAAVEDPTSPNLALTVLGSAATDEVPNLLEPPAVDGVAERGSRTSVDLLENAVARAEDARAELADAETALQAAVLAAREEGLSWRTIAHATGIGYREAVACWGPPDGRPAL